SGWSVSSITSWQSGNPFSILSKRGTLLRAQRSTQNTASSLLTKSQLDDLLQFRMTSNGPFIVPASESPTPQSVFNPGPGEIGSLQRRWFSGPWQFNLDLALLNTIMIESQSIELRGEALNVLNHPTWFVDDQDINSAS